MNLDAKKRFLENKELSSRHRDIVVSEPFLRAAEVALVQMVMETPAGISQEEAAASFHRIIGARDFLKNLINAAELPLVVPKTPTPNLKF